MSIKRLSNLSVVGTETLDCRCTRSLSRQQTPVQGTSQRIFMDGHLRTGTAISAVLILPSRRVARWIFVRFFYIAWEKYILIHLCKKWTLKLSLNWDSSSFRNQFLKPVVLLKVAVLLGVVTFRTALWQQFLENTQPWIKASCHVKI